MSSPRQRGALGDDGVFMPMNEAIDSDSVGSVDTEELLEQASLLSGSSKGWELIVAESSQPSTSVSPRSSRRGQATRRSHAPDIFDYTGTSPPSTRFSTRNAQPDSVRQRRSVSHTPDSRHGSSPWREFSGSGTGEFRPSWSRRTFSTQAGSLPVTPLSVDSPSPAQVRRHSVEPPADSEPVRRLSLSELMLRSPKRKDTATSPATSRRASPTSRLTRERVKQFLSPKTPNYFDEFLQ